MGRQSHTQLYGGVCTGVAGVHFRVIKCDGKDDEIFHYMLNRTRGENKSAFYDVDLFPPPSHSPLHRYDGGKYNIHVSAAFYGVRGKNTGMKTFGGDREKKRKKKSKTFDD
jgi:hypothetical protein